MSDYFSYGEKERVEDIEKAILQYERDLYEREKHFNKEQIVADLTLENKQLKQQLAEKEQEIEQFKQEKKNAGEEKATREFLETLSKDQVIDLCLQYLIDVEITEKQLEALMLEISKQEVEQHKPAYCTLAGTGCTYFGKVKELQQQLAEKDKEIEKLKQQLEQANEIINNPNTLIAQQQELIESLNKQLTEKGKQLADKQKLTFMHSKEDYFQRCNLLEEENIKLQFSQTQLAIQELEKVKVELRAKLHLLESGYLRHFVAWRDICDQINKQIKELRGENEEV